MKSREAVLRLKRFQTEERRRQVNQIESMVADFERMAKELDDQIKVEEQRSGISDPEHFAYPTFAKAAATRRDNLRASAEELRGQLIAADAAFIDAAAELVKLEALVVRDHGRAPAEERVVAAGGVVGTLQNA
jgi:flagellar export protein FliJ